MVNPTDKVYELFVEYLESLYPGLGDHAVLIILGILILKGVIGMVLCKAQTPVIEVRVVNDASECECSTE